MENTKDTKQQESPPSPPAAGSARCWDCEEWEPLFNEPSGWCPVFQKETSATHGSQCTAFKSLKPNTKLSGGANNQ